MKRLLLLISFAGLGLVIVPPAVYLAGAIGKEPMITWMLVGSVVWFASAPFWMGRSGADGGGPPGAAGGAQDA